VFTINRKPRSGSNGNRVHDPPESAFTMDRNTHLVALRLPRHAETYQPRRLPFWGISDAAARITRLLAGLPDGGDLGMFLPAIPQARSDRALHCRAAVAATLVAGLELTRGGAVTLQQDMSWQPIQLRRREYNPKDSAAEPTTGKREPSLA